MREKGGEGGENSGERGRDRVREGRGERERERETDRQTEMKYDWLLYQFGTSKCKIPSYRVEVQRWLLIPPHTHTHDSKQHVC